MADPTAPLEQKVVDRLLDLLGDSDKFRELFQKDPGHAIALLGHTEPATAAGCLAVKQLASKEAIRAAHAELRSMLLRGLAQISPNLDATRSGG